MPPAAHRSTACPPTGGSHGPRRARADRRDRAPRGHLGPRASVAPCGDRPPGTTGDVDVAARFGAPLPALRAPAISDEYDAYMAFLPGDWLRRLRRVRSSGCWNANVRSFMQFTGFTNKGMRDTIRALPSRFLAYNTGISATAAEVRLVITEWGTESRAFATSRWSTAAKSPPACIDQCARRSTSPGSRSRPRSPLSTGRSSRSSFPTSVGTPTPRQGPAGRPLHASSTRQLNSAGRYSRLLSLSATRRVFARLAACARLDDFGRRPTADNRTGDEPVRTVFMI